MLIVGLRFLGVGGTVLIQQYARVVVSTYRAFVNQCAKATSHTSALTDTTDSNTRV